MSQLTQFPIPIYTQPAPTRGFRQSWARRAVLLAAAVALGVSAAKIRSMDPAVTTDPVTGCQYLQFGIFGSQAVPRLGRSGKPICAGTPSGPPQLRT